MDLTLASIAFHAAQQQLQDQEHALPRKSACLSCQKSKVHCPSYNRPCERCIRLGRQCVDTGSSNRGPKVKHVQDLKRIRAALYATEPVSALCISDPYRMRLLRDLDAIHGLAHSVGVALVPSCNYADASTPSMSLGFVLSVVRDALPAVYKGGPILWNRYHHLKRLVAKTVLAQYRFAEPGMTLESLERIPCIQYLLGEAPVQGKSTFAHEIQSFLQSMELLPIATIIAFNLLDPSAECHVRANQAASDLFGVSTSCLEHQIATKRMFWEFEQFAVSDVAKFLPELALNVVTTAGDFVGHYKCKYFRPDGDIVALVCSVRYSFYDDGAPSTIIFNYTLDESAYPLQLVRATTPMSDLSLAPPSGQQQADASVSVAEDQTSPQEQQDVLMADPMSDLLDQHDRQQQQAPQPQPQQMEAELQQMMQEQYAPQYSPHPHVAQPERADMNQCRPM
eukprot:TRINITY_DN7239_c0_g1_i1.p1 TRINITY_DN7239_c0_g1~~TRINITY_DN7239_c0_g1_i1.p1  ORF type:complete len:475 (+),score=83.64 TRINITY_DN7239_c0_g1_i1:70-1425(+)